MMAAVLRYELDEYATQLPLHADEQEWPVASPKSSYPFPLLKEAHEDRTLGLKCGCHHFVLHG